MKHYVSIMLLVAGLAAITAAVTIRPRAGHPVTPAMSAAADAVSGQVVDHADQPSANRPQIVIFILPGCPCSEAYEPYTHRLFEAYRERADFLGIVAGTMTEAETWKREHKTPFPITADPDEGLARMYGAKRSAYTALLVQGNMIQRLWPGYSAEMLNEVGSQIALQTGTSIAEIDTAGAPSQLTSGCYLTD